MELLKKADKNKYPIFTYENYITYAKVVSCYDGDTCNIIFLYNNIPIHVKGRLYGYDSPEIKISIDDPERINKKNKAINAKNRLWYLCTKTENIDSYHENLVKILCGKFDKYGRLLITIYPEDYNITEENKNDIFKYSINQQMIEEGYGYVYYGGKKQ